jgi:type I restriction enzyme, S subunit
MQSIGNSYLKYIDLVLLENWSVQGLLDSKFNYSKKYDFARIGDFLIKSRNIVNIEDDKVYSRVTVKINNNGVVLRDTEKGVNIGTKKQYRAKTGQFIISKIDARNGAFGIIPNELDNAIVTNDFPLFDVNTKKINTHFLLLVTTTKAFIKFAQSCSSGTTNRQRMDIEMFLNQKIPLPRLEEQDKIVSSYLNKVEEAEKLEKLAFNLEVEIENYFFSVLEIDKRKDLALKKGLNLIEYANLSKWSLNHINKDVYDFESAKFKTERLKNLLTFFEGGKTPSKSRSDFWDGNIYWTSPKDFSGLIAIEKAEDKITQLAVKEAGMKVYPKGIILSVFRSGILQHSFPTAITQIETAINQDLKAYSLKEDLIDKKYYLYFVHTFKKYILSLASKKSVTVESINTEDFFQIPIPLPPIDIQKKISNNITNLKNKIDDLKSQKIKLEHAAQQQFEEAIFNS